MRVLSLRPHFPNCLRCMDPFHVALVPRMLPLSAHHYPWVPYPGTTRVPWCPLIRILTLPSTLPWTPTLMISVVQHAETTAGSSTCLPSPIHLPPYFPCTLTRAGTCSHLTFLPGVAISWSSISQTGTWIYSLPDVVVHPFDFQWWALLVAPSCRYCESVRMASFGNQNPCRAYRAAQSSPPLFVCLWRVGT